MEDGHQGQRGCGWRTTAAGAAGPGGGSGVRGIGACRRRLRPDMSLEELQPRAPTFTSRTTTGWAEDRGSSDEEGRRSSCLVGSSTLERHDAPGSAVCKDSDEA